MYEEISIKKRIDWKSLIIKIGILLIVVFVICAVAFSPRKTYAVTPLNDITQKLLNAGKEYFTFENLPIHIGNYKLITLDELINQEYIKSKNFEDNKCDLARSYVKVTKVNSKEFSIYAKVECNNDEEIIVDTIKTKEDTTKNTSNYEENFSFEVVE